MPVVESWFSPAEFPVHHKDLIFPITKLDHRRFSVDVDDVIEDVMSSDKNILFCSKKK